MKHMPGVAQTSRVFMQRQQLWPKSPQKQTIARCFKSVQNRVMWGQKSKVSPKLPSLHPSSKSTSPMTYAPALCAVQIAFHFAMCVAFVPTSGELEATNHCCNNGRQSDSQCHLFLANDFEQTSMPCSLCPRWVQNT